MSEFFAMGGYAFYVWGAYGVAALIIVVEVIALRGRRKAALEEARLSMPETPSLAASSGSAA
jgi:heme exporter protein D